MTGMIAIGERIEAQRLAKGMSRQQLADMLQVKYETIRRWEHGGAMPRPNRFLALCEALACDERYLVLGIIDKKTNG